MVHFRVLGPLSVDVDGCAVAVTARRDRVVLAMLLLARGGLVSTDTLIEAVWDERPVATARTQLQACVMRLRKLLGAATVVGEPAGYGIPLSPGQLDMMMFDDLLVEARASGDPALFRRALALWRGDALAGVDSPLVHHQAAALNESRTVAIEDWIDAELDAGNERALAGELTGLVERFPLRERLRGQLMTTLYRVGRQADALAEYHRVRTALVEELGIDPGPELRSLHEQILTRRMPATAGAPVTRQRIPVPAQLPMDVYGFTGRQVELGRLDAVFEQAAPTVIVGAVSGTAGAGKTNLEFWHTSLG